MLECVINVSEGADRAVLESLVGAAGGDLLDIHADPHHNRAVLTLVGEDAPRAVAARALEALDIGSHRGVHPRLGVVDVVPFVALDGSSERQATLARDSFARWMAGQHGVPCFLYGPERSLPEVRRHAFAQLSPDTGPATPHPTAGATAVGARPVLVAYNLWLSDPDEVLVGAVAKAVRGRGIRALGLSVGGRAQVSMNLVDPERVGPAEAYDRVVAEAARLGGSVASAELVGLLGERVLRATEEARWAELGLSADRTIEARLAGRQGGTGSSGG